MSKGLLYLIINYLKDRDAQSLFDFGIRFPPTLRVSKTLRVWAVAPSRPFFIMLIYS